MKNDWLKKVTKFISTNSFIFIAILVIAVYGFVLTNNGVRFNWGHISGILSSQNTVIVGIMSLGMAMVIITGGIDLSLGSSLVVCTGLSIVTYNVTNSILLMILAGIVSGALCGLVNGLLVGYIGMPPFIATLGTQLIYRSVMLFTVRDISADITGSSSSQFMLKSETPHYDFLRFTLGNGKLTLGSVGIPYITLVLIIMVALFVVISKKTKFGKRVYAVGSNATAARLAGIDVNMTKCLVYTITGALVGVASILQACKLGNITPASSGTSYEMYAVIACVLGGINMAGGRGELLGVAFGAISYSAVSMIIVSIPGLSVDIQNAFQGLVLITVILIQLVGPMIKERINLIKKRKANKAIQG